MNVTDELRMTLMKCFYDDIKKLEQKLMFRDVEDTIADLRTCIYPTMFDPSKTLNYEDIINPLHQIKTELIQKYNSLYLEDLDQMIDKVKIFKTHFAALDIRQVHSVHYKTIEEILKKSNIISGSLDELTKEELTSVLLHKKIHVHPDLFDDELIKDTIINIAQLKVIQKKNGEDGCNRYVISNSEDIFPVFFVYALFRWCGWEKERITFDIIPLFESMEGMKNSGNVMKELFDIPEYRSHLLERRNKQTIMFGFSDGTKDGGFLKANWSIFQTKENLSAVCDQYGIKAIFFDGRAGHLPGEAAKRIVFILRKARKSQTTKFNLPFKVKPLQVLMALKNTLFSIASNC